MKMKNNYIIRNMGYFFYNLKWWTWKRFKFQVYLWYIGGIYSGYFTRPNEQYFPIRVKLFDLWNYLFVTKIKYDDTFGKGKYYNYEQQNKNPFRQKVSIRSLFCLPGWDMLIMHLIKQLIKNGWNREFCQCKEKFGGLRFYINGASTEVHELITKAEDASYKICEQCGSSTEVTQTNGRWINTYCKKCLVKNNKTKTMNLSECHTIEVGGCRSCPFIEHNRLKANTKHYYANCLFPAQFHTGKYKVDSYFKNSKSPKWCPLKKMSKLIIKHK